jgi:predicted secreted hydrolase
MRRVERWLVALVLSVAADGVPAAQLRLDAVLGQTDMTGFARAERVRPFEFPRDHGPHERYRSEWWYLTVNVQDDATGAVFGVQFTVFRQATTPAPVDAGPWTPNQVYLAHFAVSDVSARRHRAAERLARGHPALAGARAEPFSVWVDGWRLHAPAGDFGALQLDVATADTAARLQLTPMKPPATHGDRGLSPKGPGQASYYYSFTRLGVAGVIELDGRVHTVTGYGWFDREWSTSLLAADQVGWDWFGLQFDAGEELMVFQLRRADGRRDRFDQGTWVREDGSTRALASADFDLEPVRYWRDPRGVYWPVEWALTLRLPEGERRLRVVGAFDAQLMETLLTYWEGLVFVIDETGTRIGAGYMELTGYE